MPIAMPMSADFEAGASLTPSPVIATMLPSTCSAFTMRSLCSGATRAYTETWPTASEAVLVQPLEFAAAEGHCSGRCQPEIA